jgi:hypothetical protein
MTACLGPDMRVVNKKYSLVAQPWRKIVCAHNNWLGTVWVPHLSERIYSIGAKTKSHIPWIIRKILLGLYMHIILEERYFPLPSFPLIIVEILLNVVIPFVTTCIAPWTLIFEFMFFSI